MQNSSMLNVNGMYETSNRSVIEVISDFQNLLETCIRVLSEAVCGYKRPRYEKPEKIC
jgi:hypothetical protein